MKILQINAVNNIRSTGRTTLETSVFLEENKHESFVAYASGTPSVRNKKIGTNIDHKIHGFLSRLSGKQAYFSKSETRNLLEYISGIKPDVVHLRNLHANYININILLNYLAVNDIPTVVTLHDCWFYTGKCTHYTVDNCFKWKTECDNCPRLKKDNPSWFLDRTNEMYFDKKKNFKSIRRLAVVGVSDWITNEAKMSFLSNATILKRIYNWIDLEKFKPVQIGNFKKALDIEGKYVILGIASQWNEEKGLSKFIDLAKHVSDDTVILLIGNIDNDIVLPPNILSIRETHDIEELVKYYSLADVLLNLSLEESFGKVTAESLACGTPAIVLNSTASPELIGEGCGIVINNNNMEKILNSIAKIKDNGKRNYSDNCIAFAKSNFAKEDRLNDYLNLYKQIIST